MEIDHDNSNSLPLNPLFESAQETVSQELLLNQPSPEIPIQLTATGRPQRRYRLPKKFQDLLPEPPTPIVPAATPDVPEPARLPRVILIVRDRLISAANKFGIWRDYPSRPTYDPDSFLLLDELATPAGPIQLPSDTQQKSSAIPFVNESIKLLMRWMTNGNTQKSEREVNSLVNDVILNPNFRPEDLRGFEANREGRRIDESIHQSELLSNFTEVAVDISVPSGVRDQPPSTFKVPGLYCRKITEVIKEAFSDPLAHHYHLSPFKLFHKSADGTTEERIYNEVYTSDAFIKEHEDVNRRSPPPPDNPDCKLEKVVAAVMLASDATHLTNFGTAKAWPIYLMLGNLSKYFRAQPKLNALHHLAYIPSVSLHACF
jgi:hypothetical protein